METRSRATHTNPLPSETLLFASHPLFKREKFLMERSFLPDIDPKDRETYRKRLLRNFFISVFDKFSISDSTPPSPPSQFWSWVKNANPDTLKGEGKFKSISYSFLDFWLSKEKFREALLEWMGTYEHTLTFSQEDHKLHLFITFVRAVCKVKTNTARLLSEYCCSLPLLPLLPHPPADALFTQSVANKPGLYLTSICVTEGCPQKQSKAMVFVGGAGAYEYERSAAHCMCFECFGTCKTVGLALSTCRWQYSYVTETGELIMGKQTVTL